MPEDKPLSNPSLDYHRRANHRVDACMGFCGRPKGEYFTWSSVPQVPFRAQGLLVWGATNETALHEILVGRERQLIVSTGPFPARFFEAGITFAEFQVLLDPESRAALQLVDDDWSPLAARPRETAKDFFAWMSKQPLISPHQRKPFSTCSPGVSLSLTLSGPIEALALWGDALR